MKEIKLIVLEPTDKNVAAQLEEQKEVLRQIRKENRKKEVHKNLMLAATSILVIAVAFALGIIVGRALGFLYAMGC